MSYILDALRKAEQERHLGQAPNPVLPSPAYPIQQRLWLWLVVGLGLGANLMLLAFFLIQPPSQSENPAMRAAETTATVPPAPAAPAAPAVPSPSTPPLVPPVPSVAAPSVEPHKKGSSGGSVGAPLAVPVPAVPAPAAAPRKKDAGSSTPTPAATLPPPIVSPDPRPEIRPKGERTGSTALENRERRPKLRSGPSVTIGPDPPPFLDTLPANARPGIPAMNLDLHAYSPDASKRFVVVNGRRYREGDQISPGVVLESVTTNGAVLRQGGQRFRLSVRR